jgi:hypothetical protein
LHKTFLDFPNKKNWTKLLDFLIREIAQIKFLDFLNKNKWTKLLDFLIRKIAQNSLIFLTRKIRQNCPSRKVVISETFWTKICGSKPGPDLKLGIRLRHVAFSEKPTKPQQQPRKHPRSLVYFPGVFRSFGDCPE